MTASVTSASIVIRPRFSFQGLGPKSAPAWEESPGGISVRSHANRADRLLIRTTAVGQAGAGDPGTGQTKGTPKAARSVASHPVSPAPILTAIHPEPPERHSQIRSKIEQI